MSHSKTILFGLLTAGLVAAGPAFAEMEPNGGQRPVIIKPTWTASGSTGTVSGHKDGYDIGGGRTWVNTTIATPTGTDTTSKVIVAPKPKKQPKVAAPKPQPKPQARGQSWASAYDPASGTTTVSVSNGDGSRTVTQYGQGGAMLGTWTSR